MFDATKTQILYRPNNAPMRDDKRDAIEILTLAVESIVYQKPPLSGLEIAAANLMLNSMQHIKGVTTFMSYGKIFENIWESEHR